MSGVAYDVTVPLRNHIGATGEDLGNPGIMYNVQDLNNFDFVVFR